MTSAQLDLNERISTLMAKAPGLWRLDACGVTRSERPTPVLLHPNAYVPATSRKRVLLVGGLSGRPDEVELALSALESYASGSKRLTGEVALSAIPCGNPDGLATGVAPGNGVGGNPSVGYPPVANFFYDPQNPEARYLWRWMCFNAPDLLLEVRAGDTVRWEISDPTSRLASALKASRMAQDDSLLAALSVGNPSGLAPIPGLRLSSPPGSLGAELGRLWSALAQPRALGPSPARRALDSRRSRSALDVAHVLAATYGHKLDPVIYTQGVAISGRLRLARLDSKGLAPVQEVARLVEPYLSGEKPMFGDQASGQHFAGIVWAEELLELTGDRRYADALVSAADRYQPSEEGKAPPPSDPDFRTEDMFFSAAILGRAFKLTGDRRYMEMLVRFLLDARVQQGDGLFWHCRSAPYYWGRGNGFAALGYAEALSYMPPGHPERDALLAMHIRHLNALRQVQNPSGMWLQVLNFPGSYQEMSVTCMVGYALARGLRLGWLDSSFRPSLELAWQGVSERIDDAGGLVDICTGTGVQKSLRDYLDRPAIFGLDDRGGSLALWFATEMEQFLRRA